MDIIRNWNHLNSRIKKENPELVKKLFQIHMGCFDDLRRSGHMIKASGKPVSELAPMIQPQERLILAGNIGQNLVKPQGDLFNMELSIDLADYFSNCIFIALTAMLEDMREKIHVMYPDKRVAVVCKYETASGNNDPLGKVLPLVEQCFSWVSLTSEVHLSGPVKTSPPRYISRDQSSLFFTSDKVTKIDTMRTVFAGTIRRGSIQKGDVLNVTDSTGKVLCHEGIVMKIYVKGQEYNRVNENQHIDEMCLAVEIPNGDYPGIFLIDGDKTLALSKQMSQQDKSAQKSEPLDTAPSQTSKKGFWSKLFKGKK